MSDQKSGRKADKNDEKPDAKSGGKRKKGSGGGLTGVRRRQPGARRCSPP